MRNKILSAFLSVIILLSVLISGNVFAVSTTTVMDDINKFNIKSANCENLNEWITEYLPKKVAIGTEWYAMALSQNGSYNFSKYATALDKYLSCTEVSAITSRQKFALTLSACNSSSDYIAEIMDTTVGKQGIMSYIFGLHLFNNGYISNITTKQEVIDTLLSLQLSDGGWTIFGNYGDCDVTAMTLQSLAPNIENSSVQNSVNKALVFLSAKQNSDASYSSYGQANCESTAQVLLALSSLNINPESDARFIKNGKTVIDALLTFRLPDGTFCHTVGGAYSKSATYQTYYCTVGYLRMLSGKKPFYIFDNCNPAKVNEKVLKRKDTATTSSATFKPTHGSSVSSKAENSAKPTVTDNNSKVQSNFGATVSEKVNTASKVVTPNITAPTADKTTSKKANTSKNSNSSVVSATNSKTDKANKKNTDKTNTVTSKESESFTVSNSSVASKSAVSGTSFGFSTVKIIIIVAILLSAVAVCVLLKVKKRFNLKNILAVVFSSVVLILAVVFINISTPKEYYGNTASYNTEKSVTISIECSTINGKTPHDNNVLVPKNYTILENTEVAVADADTVYDVLVNVAKQNKLQIDYSNGYVKGIGGIYEFDWGELSGWMYFVNGKSAEVGCNNCTVNDGDVIEWRYTCNIGEDLK